MAHPSDVLIGVHVETATVRAVAFDREGRELGLTAVPITSSRLADGGLEQDMAETWQATARSVRLLAQRVPDLARRAVALGITGQAGGAWLIDEDGDPVGAALLRPGHGAAELLEAWRRSAVGPAVSGITGSALTPSLQSVQLAWLRRHRPEALDAAATVFHTKDWLYFCCTGERATDPCEALAAYGDLRSGDYDPRVLQLLNLEEAAPLLPEIVDGSRRHAPLLPAAAAALGLWEDTPVVLAPPAGITSGLAAGLHGAAADCGCSVLGTAAVHMRWRRELAPIEAAPDQVGSTVPVAAAGGFCRLVTAAAATPGPEWVVGLGEQLLADMGLIGISGGDLAAMLEQRAGRAEPGAVLLQPGAAASGERALLIGISDRTSLHDLMRAVYEGQGFAAREAYAALGYRPKEVRLAGEGASRPVLRQIVSACIGAPTRRLLRHDAPAAGAAWFAAVSLGHYQSLAEGIRDWVEPYLEAAEPLDQALCSVYELLLELRRPRG